MCDKDIRIGIETNGAAAAAGEIAKVEKAVDKTTDALGGGKSPSGGLAGGAKKAAAELDKLGKEKNKVSGSSVNMGSKVQQVGYQVQDFAVQVGSGTSALRAFGQQAPQLLGAFGPVGVVLGTIVAIGAPLAGVIAATGKAGTESEEGLEKFNKKLKDLRERATEIAGAKSASTLKAWIEALDDEEEAWRGQNTEIKRQIDLLALLKAQQGLVDEAKRDEEIANITFNPNKTEAQKTREIAVIREQGEWVKTQEKLEALEAKRKAAATAADEAAGVAFLKDDAANAAANQAAELEAEKKALEARFRISNRGGTTKARVEQEITELKTSIEARFGAAGNAPSGIETAARKELAELQLKLEAAEKERQTASGADRLRAGGIDADIATAKAAAEAKAKELADARKAAADAKRASEDAEELAKRGGPKIVKEYAFRKNARSLATEAKATPLELAEEQQRLREELEQSRRDAALKTSSAAVDSRTAMGDPRTVGREAIERQSGISKALGGIREALSTADTEQELAEAREMIIQSQNVLGQKMVSSLLALAEAQRSILDRLSQVESQLKYNPGR